MRQIVAESPGISEEVRRDFSRRADIAGSVLQTEHDETSSPLRIFTFSRVDATTWLLARAISLGIYRKGSHQLLVHGLLLSEEILDELEGNPLALDFLSQHELDFSFQDTHPGFGQELEQMVLSREIAGQARAYNRQRLESLRAADDAWLSHAYDQLAVGARLACVSAHPRASNLEALLLHLHPDDRLELSFHTFYSHSRAIDYRLIGVLASDLSGIERQFRGLESTRVDQPEPARR
ncbi:MAG: hypothetical protein AAF560_19410, partial [Acidobacteriota bacterium]